MHNVCILPFLRLPAMGLIIKSEFLFAEAFLGKCTRRVIARSPYIAKASTIQVDGLINNGFNNTKQ
jgi:hypothetical protein